tara:strand:+ start:2238 stop:3167 length:930 start_codon:yes stop_codon:yes gene_type:complete
MKVSNIIKFIFFSVLIYFVWLTFKNISFIDICAAIQSIDTITYGAAFFLMLTSTIGGQSAFFIIYIRRYFNAHNALIEIIKINVALQFYTLILPGGAVALIRHKKFLNSGLPVLKSLGVIVFYRLMLLAVSSIVAAIYIAKHSVLFMSELDLSSEYLYTSSIFFVFLFLVLLSIVLFLLKKRGRGLIARIQGLEIFVLKPMIFSGLTVLISLMLGALSYWLVFLSFDITFSFLDVFMLRSTIFFFQIIPFSIAGVGVREIILAIILPIYGINETLTATIMIVVFSFQLLLGLIGGAQELFNNYKKGART